MKKDFIFGRMCGLVTPHHVIHFPAFVDYHSHNISIKNTIASSTLGWNWNFNFVRNLSEGVSTCFNSFGST